MILLSFYSFYIIIFISYVNNMTSSTRFDHHVTDYEYFFMHLS